jgi:hypothetical protein
VPRPPEGLAALSTGVVPAPARAGAPLVVRVDKFPPPAARAVLFHRSGPRADRYSRVEASVPAGAPLALTIPGEQVRAPILEHYLVMLDGKGVPLAGAGSLADPVRVTVTEPKRPLYKRAWLWGTIGGVLAAGAIATALALTLVPEPPAQVTLSPR